MRRRLWWIGLGAVVAAGAVFVAKRPAVAPPNVLLIVVDTLRADHVGCYGYPRPTTPHLDALAAQGTRFADARAASSWTAASVASILTGLYAPVHGVEGGAVALSDEAETIAERFAAHGYATALFSANAANVTPEQGFAQGFGEFRVLHGREVPRSFRGDRIPLDPYFQRFAQVAPADLVTETARAWLASRTPTAQPFLLYLQYFDPHAGYFPPARYRERFGVAPDEPLAGPAQWDFWVSFALGGGRDRLATLRGLYDGEVAFTDDAIGVLLASDELRRAGPTIIVVTSDHGEEFGEHGGLQHGSTLFDEQLRVPLVLAGPGIPASTVASEPVSLAALPETLAALAGLPASRVAGIQPPFTSVLAGRAPASAPVFADLSMAKQAHRHAVVLDGWKLVTTTTATRELYDLTTDAAETTDRAAMAPARGDALATTLAVHDAASARSRIASKPADDSALRRARLKALGYAE